MSDEYQLRKDIDRIYADLYQIDDNSVNVLTFRDRSKLKYLGNSDEISTIDDIFDYYQLYERGDGDGGDLSDYVKKSELTEDYDVDLDFQFGLSGQDDTIRINTAIVEKLLNVKQININGD